MSGNYNSIEPDAFLREEFVDKNKLDQLINCDEISSRDIQILKEIKLILKNKKSYKVAYAHSNKYGLGRLYAVGLRIQNLSRKVRECLCCDYYYDFDMVNAAFVILKKICVENNVDHKYLSRYIDDRELYLNKTIEYYDQNECFPLDRSHAKKLITMLLFGGSFLTWKKDHQISENLQKLKFIVKFENEFKEITNWAWNKYPDLQDKCAQIAVDKNIKNKYSSNKKATLLSLLLQDEEKKLLLETEQFLTSKGYSVGVLMFDGALIKKDLEHDFISDNTIIKELEIHLRKKTNYDVAFTIKEMINEFTEIDDDNIIPNKIKIDDTFAAKQFVKLMGNNIVYTDESIYIFYTGLWRNDNIILEQKIQNDFNKQLKFDQIKNGKKVSFNYSGDVAKKNKMINCLSAHCYKKRFFTHSKIKSGFGKIQFENAMYDMDNDEIKDFTSDIILFSKIDRKFPERDEEKIAMVHKIIFEDPYVDPNVALRLKQEIALAIHGKYYKRKKLILCLGNSNTCKSVTVDIIKETFGDYVGTWSTNDLVESTFESNDARRLGFLIPIYKNRINLASEYKENKKLSSEMLKMICSGGDTVEARALYKESSKFRVYSTFFAFTNHPIKFTNSSEDAIVKKIDGEIEFEVEFTDNPDPENPLRSKLGNPDIKELISDDSDNTFVNGFFWIIMDTYKELKNNNFKVVVPDSFKDSASVISNKNDKNQYGKLFKKIYDKTHNEKDIVFLSEIEKKFVKFKTKDEIINRSSIKLDLGNVGINVDTSKKHNSLTKLSERMWIQGWKFNLDKYDELIREKNEIDYL